MGAMRASSRRTSVTRGEHQRIVVVFGVAVQNLVGDQQSRRGEVDVVQVIFDDAVAGDDKQVAGTDRDFLRCQHFGYPVTDDPAGKARRRAHLDAGWVFGDQVGCHIADPAQLRVSARKSMRANVIAAPLVPDRAR